MPYTIVVLVHVNAMTMIKTTVVAGIDPLSVIQTFIVRNSRETAIFKAFYWISRRYGDSLHDDSLQGAHSYLDSKIFAAAGASFNFSMAAALAADSLAGMN